jgi:hypothetical protein
MSALVLGDKPRSGYRGQAFGQLRYPTSPEHVNENHIEQAWLSANERVAARLGEHGR